MTTRLTAVVPITDVCALTVQNVSIEGDTLVINTDAVIVGSGAGGGVTAALLAAAGAQASTC